MARRLSAAAPDRRRARRRAAWAVLVIGVIVVHGWVTEGLVQRLAALDANPLPPRIEVAYVREMALAAPPPAAARAAPGPPNAVMPPRRARPARAASASAASAPAAQPGSAPARAEVERPAPPPAAAESAAPVDSVAAAASAASGAGATFEWPASTRLSYVLTGNYRGEVSGSAQVEWLRDGSHYQVHVDFIVGPSFAPLITQRSSSDGEITAAGLVPRRYDQDVRFLGSDRPRQTVLFDAGGVVLANGDVRPLRPGLQDTASQFVQLAYVFGTDPSLLRVGASVDIPLALPKKVDVWTYDVVDEETLATPFGPVVARHLKPRGEQKAGSLSVEMWMAPQLRYLPVRLRFAQDAATFVDLVIARPPEMSR